jgi:hypothetical protein
MVGLVNAVGVTAASRELLTQRSATDRPTPEGNLAPILSAEQAANKVLHKAVESMRFQETARQRGSPTGEQSDQFQQADLESRPTGALGTVLDVTA